MFLVDIDKLKLSDCLPGRLPLIRNARGDLRRTRRHGAKVRPYIIARANRKGVERRMAYLLAIWTGLRRSQLTLLEWQDVRLEAEVLHILLHAETTKSGRADTLPLHTQLVNELSSFKPEKLKPTDRVLPRVPDMDVMKLDLTFAGIPYGDRQTGYADLHSMRTALNNLLAANRVASRTRQ